MISQIEMPDHYVMTVDQACETFFHGHVKPPALRRARDDGILPMTRVGRRDFVTAGAIRSWMKAPKWRDQENQPDSGSTKATESGVSSTADQSAALAAALKTASALTKRSKTTSPKNSNQNSAKVISPEFRSRRH